MYNSDLSYYLHRSSETLHVKLSGIFDDRAASYLPKLLQKNCYGVNRVFIYTDGLTRITFDSELQDDFQRSLRAIQDVPLNIQFVGQKASKIVPNHSLFFYR